MSVRWDEINVRILRVIAQMGGRHADVAQHVGCTKAASRAAASKYRVKFWGEAK